MFEIRPAEGKVAKCAVRRPHRVRQTTGNVARTPEAHAWPTEKVLVGWDPRFSRATHGLADTEARNPQRIASVEYCRSAVDLKARQALMLVGASGLSYHEAAGVGGCPLGTMKSRVSRALARMLAIYGPDYFEPDRFQRGHRERTGSDANVELHRPRAALAI